MSLIKTAEEIEKLQTGGKVLSDTLREIRSACVIGASAEDLDAIALKRFKEAGGTPSFLNYKIAEKDPGCPGALCVSVNSEVVHGPPVPGRKIKDGDIVGLDLGLWYEGLCTDMATTVIVGEVSEEIRELVQRTREALKRGLGVIRGGASIGDIGAAIEDYIKPFGYSIIRDLVGHGVGHAVHENPQVPNYRDPESMKVPLQTGMVLAIEPMITLGTSDVVLKEDKWTIATADESICAHFEVTIAVTDGGYELITPWPDEK